MSEFAMHVVKPVVLRMSLADTSIVEAARSGIPTSHRGRGAGDLILSRDREWYVPKIYYICSARCVTKGRKVVYVEDFQSVWYDERDQRNLKAKCCEVLMTNWRYGTRSRCENTQGTMTRKLWINQIVWFYREALKGRVTRVLAYIHTQGRTKKEVWAERITIKEIEDVQREFGKECERGKE